MGKLNIARFIKKDGRILWLYGYAPYAFTPLPEGQDAPKPHAHLRWHPLREQWVVYAAHRQGRTFLPPKEHCPLCPSRPGGLPGEIPFEDFEIAVFENRFPALSTASEAPPGDLPIPTARAEGACEVVVYTPEHQGSLAALSQAKRELLVRVWIERYLDLSARSGIRYVMPFENRGEQVGVTLHHPHGQIYSYPFIPPVPGREARSFGRRPVLLELIPELGPYMVFADQHVLAFVPPFAHYPYEVWIAPRAFHPGPWTFSDAEIESFARALGQVVARLDKLFSRAMPYVMVLHAAPKGKEEYFHFHVEFYPYLRDKQKMKYLAGTELGAGIFAVDVLPEEAAKALRELVL